MSSSQDENTPLLPLPGNQLEQKTPKKNNSAKDPSNQPAVELIQQKIEAVYNREPQAEDELKEALAPGGHSKHQLFLIELHSSGKSMEQIQVDWHKYYESLSDEDKHEVWKEFYSNQSSQESPPNVSPGSTTSEADVTSRPMHKLTDIIRDKAGGKELKDFKDKIVPTRSHRKKTGPKRRLSFSEHLKSIGFGLGIGMIVLFLYMFTFFNERFIIPFIQPSSLADSTQIISVPNAVVSAEPKVIIPKLNIEVPVIYDVPFIAPGETEKDFEARVQSALESGVVHYPTSQKPGETGRGFNSNVVIVGHSSNNLFNRGSFKFAFMQIGQLEIGDTFLINYDSKQYVYKVYENKVVTPTEVSVLGPAARPNSATLITCDPPGLNVNRRIIVAEQISPNPDKNVLTTAPVETPETTEAGVVPGNPESLWSRIWGFFSD